MNAKSLVAGLMLTAALSLMPASANALTLNAGNTLVDSNLSDNVGDGPNYDVVTGGSYGVFFSNADGAGSAIFNFINNSATSIALSIVDFTALQSPTHFFSGGVTVFFRGEEANGMTIAEAIASGFNGLTTLLDPGEIVELVVAFGDPVKTLPSAAKPGFQLTVEGEDTGLEPVPLPGALALLIPALMGLGVLGRSRRKYVRG